MWKSYCEKNTGFLVELNLVNFLESLAKSKDLNNDFDSIIFGTVKYFNFKEDVGKIKYKAFRKHISYSDERELRLVFKNHKQKLIDSEFLKPHKSFYDDMNIYIHPYISIPDYNETRNKLINEFNIDLKLSELSLAYKLRQICIKIYV